MNPGEFSQSFTRPAICAKTDDVLVVYHIVSFQDNKKPAPRDYVRLLVAGGYTHFFCHDSNDNIVPQELKDFKK